MGEFNERDMTEFENALRSLRPEGGAIDRDELMFRAGRAAGHRQGNHWRLAAGVFAVLTVTLGAALLVRPAAEVQERVRYVEHSAPTRVPVRPGPEAEPERRTGSGRPLVYYDLRERVLTEGVDALPAQRWAAGRAVTVEEMMEEMLPHRAHDSEDKARNGEERT
jgi:hypothetical protein